MIDLAWLRSLADSAPLEGVRLDTATVRAIVERLERATEYECADGSCISALPDGWCVALPNDYWLAANDGRYVAEGNPDGYYPTADAAFAALAAHRKEQP